MSATRTRSTREQLVPGVISPSSLKGKSSQSRERRRTHPGGGGPGSLGDICRCSPSSFGGSRTVRRILAACLVSLLTLLGSISLDLSNSLQMWRNNEQALRGLSSCQNLLAVHMIGFLQEERRHCCWEQPMNSKTETNQLYHQQLQDRLKAFCIHTQDRFPIPGSRCEDKESYGSDCQIYVGELERRLNYTSETKMALLLSTIISELLDDFQTEEHDLRAAKSHLDWADVSSFRLILKVHEAALQKHYLGMNYLSTTTTITPWDQITSILNYAVFSSETLQDCWVENDNLSLYTADLEEPYFNVPFKIPLTQTQLKPMVSSIGSVQSCLLQRAGEKLILKSREVLSMVSLKVSLLAVACLIYPIVLVSFKQMTEWIQNYARNLRERTEDLKQQRRLAEDLLHQMLPKYVAKQLRKHKHVEAESYEQVSIFFSDIVGFTSISASCTPLQVVEMLNNLYVCFDTRIDSYNVYKVETIGDAYMVVSGLPERNGIKHADEIAKMSLDLLAAVRQVIVPHMPKQRLQMRVGIHTGPCVAGVVGYKMPRYCLFGDTVNTASRMESTSLPQKIHISSATYEVLMVDGAYEIEPRGETEIKGKGKMKTYWLIGNKNYSIQNDSLVCHWNPAISRQKMLERSLGSTNQSSTGTVAPTLSDRTTPASGEVYCPGHPKQETTKPALAVGDTGCSYATGQKKDASDTTGGRSSDLQVLPTHQNTSTLTISVSPASAIRDCTVVSIPHPGTFGRTAEANTFLPGSVGGTERPS